jgi:hypothetical protein
LKALSYYGRNVHHQLVAGIQALKDRAEIVGLFGVAIACAYAHARVWTVNFGNFAGSDGH